MAVNDNETAPFRVVGTSNDLRELNEFLTMIQECHPDITGNDRWCQMYYQIVEELADTVFFDD